MLIALALADDQQAIAFCSWAKAPVTSNRAQKECKDAGRAFHDDLPVARAEATIVDQSVGFVPGPSGTRYPIRQPEGDHFWRVPQSPWPKATWS